MLALYHRTLKIGILVLSVFLSSQAYSFVTIQESAYSTYFVAPTDLVPMVTRAINKINLFAWNVNPQDPPLPSERYNRSFHFGEWITLNESETDCLDIRNRVLIRDTLTPVQMRQANPCKVGSGKWFDPYTQKVLVEAHDIQVDHVVALKDAYVNGAWKWNYQARCVYANYMGYKEHLIPVFGDENQLKSDKSPDEYMPPNAAYKCEYLKVWLSIKLIWKLSMQRAEAQAIQNLVNQHGCDVSQFVFSSADLRQQRDFINRSLSICPSTPPPRRTPETALVPKSH